MNYRKIIGLIILLFCLGGISYAQEAFDFQRQYLNAKSLFKEKKYNLAMEAFKPVMKKDARNQFSSYASFYYALSAYHRGYFTIARDMLLQLKKQYPQWNNMNEANFWLATVYFENKEYERGMSAASAIRTKDYADDLLKLKKYYLSQIPNYDMVLQLQDSYPNDRVMGEELANRVFRQPLNLQDKELLTSLVKKFKLDEDKFVTVDVPKSTFKPVYKVAVLLPFQVEKLEASKSKRSFVLDLYEGIKMAVDDLQEKNGINIDLLVFDTKRDTEETKKILANWEMESVDMIIGPLFPGPSQEALGFSFKNKINIVNPLSNNGEIVASHPFSFLSSPSNERIGMAAAKYVLDELPNQKPGMILYGDTKADSIRAFTYKSIAEEGGYKIVLVKKIERGNTKDILKLLTTTYEIEGQNVDEYVIARDSIESIYVASDNSLVAANAGSAVEIRGDSIKLIGSSKWLDYKFVNYDSYQKLGISLVAPNYIDFTNDKVKMVMEKYLDIYATPPPVNFYRGYDMMMFFGLSFKEFGNYFQSGLMKEGKKEGYLSDGYDYSNGNDNNNVPVIKFVDSELQVVNHSTEK